MIRTFLADITPLYTRDIYEHYYRQAPKWRREKADGMQSYQKQAQSIGAWSLLLEAWRRTGAGPHTRYNLSHSGNYVLCAFDDSGTSAAVGCDIETVKEVRLKVAKRFFCEEEYSKIIQTADEKERAQLFYRLWVLKESFMKATRQGMKLAMDSFEIGFDGNGSAYLLHKPDAFPGHYSYQEYDTLGAVAKIAVCTTGEAAKEIESISL